MKETIEFAKLSGSGNDFICIDNRDGSFDQIISSSDVSGHFTREMCHRGTGVGADGLIFASRPELEGVAEIEARFFEADGSETDLCGNGVGCFVHWVTAANMVTPGETKILTPAGIVRGQDSDGDYVRVCIPSPTDMRWDLELSAAGAQLGCDFVITGIPHVVTYVDDIRKADVQRLGPALRHHEQFAPRGANANFVQVLEPGRLALRTFEFGVEDETLACGTGSAAAAILTALRHHWDDEYLRGEKPVLIHTRGGDTLRVYFQAHEDGSVSDVCLETVVRFVYVGRVHPDLAARACAIRKLSAEGA
ncbi:MAG: diaminopimelate epimerase [Planctomycetota bacterium]